MADDEYRGPERRSHAVLRRRLLIGWIIVATVAGFWGVRENRLRTDEARSLASQIQDQRREAISSTCLASNERHDETIRALDHLIAKAKQGATAARRRQLDQSRTSTILLIAALVPKRNCAALVKRQTGDVP